MRHLWVVLVCLPVTLSAQEAAVYPGSVEACFNSARQSNTLPDCVGNAAAACSAAHSQPDTTLSISQCLMAENGVWDGLLNREYAAVREQFRDQPGLAEQLLMAQRAWIAFRDADCALAYDRYGGGSMRTISGADCQLRHTARRALELRYLQGF